MFFPRQRLWKTIFPAAMTAALLVSAYPPFNAWFLPWVALIPLMRALDNRTYRGAFSIAFFTGCIFFGGILYWFVHMAWSAEIPPALSVSATVAIVVYLSLYFGLFAAAYVFFRKMSLPWRLFVLPSVWAGLEFLRSTLFTGFGWATLGHSQFLNLSLIQIADITGVYGISFLIVMTNVFLHEFAARGYRLRSLKMPMLIVAVFLSSSLTYGELKMKQPMIGEKISVAVVQGNIAQQRKWKPRQWPGILAEYLTLTGEAAHEAPQIIIWPENSFPGHLQESPETFYPAFPSTPGLEARGWETGGIPPRKDEGERNRGLKPAGLHEIRRQVLRQGIPLLLGAVREEEGKYYNSAILISADGKMAGLYDKIHLVPFGEYVPFRAYVPALAQMVPVLDFHSGKERTVFSLPCEPAGCVPRRFSVLICFEDTVSYVARDMVNAGADFLVNMTNDAWFGKTMEPFLHLQGGVFQAVQNRRSLVRAANTGVSCFIDYLGRIYSPVEDGRGEKTFVAGFSAADVYLNDEKSFYTKFGDVFTYLCFGCILSGILYKLKMMNEHRNIPT